MREEREKYQKERKNILAEQNAKKNYSRALIKSFPFCVKCVRSVRVYTPNKPNAAFLLWAMLYHHRNKIKTKKHIIFIHQ